MSDRMQKSLAGGEWLDRVEPLTLKGQIRMPYHWSVGETGSRFLVALRDQQKILADRCGRCGRVFIPPRQTCPFCFVGMTDWTEVAAEGSVRAFTVVRKESPLQPFAPPYAYALIVLDGADTAMLHLIREPLDGLAAGCRVRAVFREERTGSIRDIERFEIL